LYIAEFWFGLDWIGLAIGIEIEIEVGMGMGVEMVSREMNMRSGTNGRQWRFWSGHFIFLGQNKQFNDRNAFVSVRDRCETQTD
jgi:hypothetical protein